MKSWLNTKKEKLKQKKSTQGLGLTGPGEGGDIPLNILRLDQHPENRNLLGGEETEASSMGKPSPGFMEGVGVETNADNSIYVIHEQHQGQNSPVTEVSLGACESESNCNL